jgi:hypothetical protein
VEEELAVVDGGDRAANLSLLVAPLVQCSFLRDRYFECVVAAFKRAPRGQSPPHMVEFPLKEEVAVGDPLLEIVVALTGATIVRPDLSRDMGEAHEKGHDDRQKAPDYSSSEAAHTQQCRAGARREDGTGSSRRVFGGPPVCAPPAIPRHL